jgi:amino acid transporter
MGRREVASVVVEPADQAPDKGLKRGALGLISSVVIGVASTAPAYSLAATLGFVVVAIGLQAPIVTILAFVPMWCISVGYNEMNKADPDCGTTFTWATRAFGPKTGWWGGWGIIAADVIVMASLAQIAGQYVFDLFNTPSIGSNAASVWVLLVGIAWIILMTAICYVGIEVSANFQKALLGIELTMLVLLSVFALVKVGNGTAPPGHLTPAASWFNPFADGFNNLIVGFSLMLFIYWGWDTAVACNEETANAETVPGKAAVISTFILLAIYALVVLAVQSFAGLGSTGVGLGNPANVNDVLSVLGPAIFGHSHLASIPVHLLYLMILSSAAASTQTTILPTARTTLSMAVYRAIPAKFGEIHKRFLTPTFSTVTMGVVSILLYVMMNFLSHGAVIGDAVSALGIWIAFYYGLTGFACAWYYRATLRESTRNLFMRGIVPAFGGIVLFLIIGWSFWYYWSATRSGSYTSFTLPFPPHQQVSGVFLIDILTIVLGIVLMLVYKAMAPAFFRGEVLNRDSATLVTEDFLAKQAQAPAASER